MINTLSFILQHPLTRKHRASALLRYIRWQLSQHIFGKPIIHTWVRGSRLIVERGMTGATGNLYCGLHEWPDMAFVLHLLRPKDLFIDIGANIGSYTLLASAGVGCRSLSLEPIPLAFEHLKRNIGINQIHSLVTMLNLAAGKEESIVYMSNNLDTMNRIVNSPHPGSAISVQCLPLDSIEEARNAVLWKIDVEGHEEETLAGASGLLTHTPPKAIMIEMRSAKIESQLMERDFRPFCYDPFSRILSSGQAEWPNNQIWISDLDWVTHRTRSSSRFEVEGIEF
jgi:FkbM family methyltransferase